MFVYVRFLCLFMFGLFIHVCLVYSFMFVCFKIHTSAAVNSNTPAYVLIPFDAIISKDKGKVKVLSLCKKPKKKKKEKKKQRKKRKK